MMEKLICESSFLYTESIINLIIVYGISCFSDFEIFFIELVIFNCFHSCFH